jgi:D-alanyl-D-alanine dipeptidase
VRIFQRIVWTAIAILTITTLPAIAADLPAGFVRLAEVDATIRQDMRYAGSANFLGRPAKGYEAPACILTRQAAEALSKVQNTLAAENLTLVVFDCYRPDRAVKDFAAWVRGSKSKDPLWHPNVRRSDLIRQGYIASRSGHSRGSTVDLAIAPVTTPPAPDPACGAQGATTLDFGTGFDCLDPTSRTAFAPLTPEAVKSRKLLVDAMSAAGFRNYKNEWWHFTLTGEPFPKERFDFPVTAD